MRKIFPPFSHLCHKCLNFAGVDPRDHRLSPLFADPSSFPQNALIITAAQGAFAIEAEKLAENIRNVDGKYVVCERMYGCAHGWDKEAVAYLCFRCYILQLILNGCNILP
jgi:acetyl esterase/lipase